MNSRAVAIISILLAGCASHEGTYSPDCIAYAGSNIELSDGRFVWEKFTDEVVVGDDGEIVDPFPGYPMRGSYAIDGDAVTLNPDSGQATQTLYLHRHDGGDYLLTAEQLEAWEKTGEYADCTLIRQP